MQLLYKIIFILFFILMWVLCIYTSSINYTNTNSIQHIECIRNNDSIGDFNFQYCAVNNYTPKYYRTPYTISEANYEYLYNKEIDGAFLNAKNYARNRIDLSSSSDEMKKSFIEDFSSYMEKWYWSLNQRTNEYGTGSERCYSHQGTWDWSYWGSWENNFNEINSNKRLY